MLFAAVVHRVIDQIRPPASVPLLAGANLQEVLTRLAGLILRAALSPPALALHKLVSAESMRFPELIGAVNSDGSTREAITLISNLLARELPEKKLTGAERNFAAQQFIFMVVSLPQRRAMGFGTPLTQAELDTWAKRVVRLFLDGCRGL